MNIQLSVTKVSNATYSNKNFYHKHEPKLNNLFYVAVSKGFLSL